MEGKLERIQVPTLIMVGDRDWLVSDRSLRDLYEVSCRELDVMVEAAEGLPGYCGGRMTGGGFGGCTVNLVHSANADEFAERTARRYQDATGIQPNVYICSAEDGAQAFN